MTVLYYIMITKCGSRSIIQTVKNNPNFATPIDPIYHDHTNGWDHREDLGSYTDFIKSREIYWPNRNDDHRLTFTFVRNPYDRAVSNWTYARKQQWTSLNFQEYLENLGQLSNLALRHCAPQSQFILDDKDDIKIDFIGRLEYDWRMFTLWASSYEIHVPQQLIHINRSDNLRPHKNYRDIYIPHTKKLVEQLYHKDFQILNYDF